MHKTRTIILAALVGGMLAFPPLADAQGRAVPRGPASGGGRSSGGGPRGGAVERPPGGTLGRPLGRPVDRTGPYRNRGYYDAPYRGGYAGSWYASPYGYGLSRGFGYGYGYGYGYPSYGYPYVYPSYGYPSYGYPGYGYSGYGYSRSRSQVRAYGGVRIVVPQRDAEVYVDGYYAGVVDDFDGALQQVNLERGPHQIEVNAEGFDPVTFDVNVEPGRTITYRTALHQARP